METQAPLRFLLAPGFTPSAKVLWLALQAQAHLPTLTQLASTTGLTIPTIRKNLALLQDLGHYAAQPSDRTTAIPPRLLAEPRVRPQAKLLYGILQTLPTTEFTYATLGPQANLSAKTTKQLVHELTQTGWITTTQRNQMAPIAFTLCNPEIDRSANEVAQAERRLIRTNYAGEAIMHLYLSLLIDSDEFEENARPGWLINPLTNETMELDRYYAPIIAFEYNGPQHYRTTKQYPSAEDLAMQRARDLMKEGHCARRGVRFVVVTRRDLTLETMKRKVGTLLPLRDLRGHEALLNLLEEARTFFKKSLN